MNTQTNVDAGEVRHFSALASRWWDTDGEFRTLHDINPARTRWIDDCVDLEGQQVLDVGCGGGLLSEAMAARGANVTGIDLSAESLQVARLHLLESGITSVDYLHIAAEDLARQSPHQWDVVTCMELLEHVPDPAALVAACATLVRPGGHVLLSTLNRTPRAWLTAIVGAEYLTRLVPRHTHRYEQFIRPSELDAWARRAGLQLRSISGASYDPFGRKLRLGTDTRVNYLAHFQAHGAPGTAP